MTENNNVPPLAQRVGKSEFNYWQVRLKCEQTCAGKLGKDSRKDKVYHSVL